MNFEIITDRLFLRPPKLSDAPELFQHMSNVELTTFLSWQAHTSVEATIAVVKSLQEGQQEGRGYHWCVCLDEKIIGLVSLIDVKRIIRTWTLNRAEISYWIAPAYQRRGFATEAARAVVSFGFEQLDFHKIIIAHAERNVESQRICDKLGFKQYAHERDAFQKNGIWNDLYWYDRLKKKQ